MKLVTLGAIACVGTIASVTLSASPAALLTAQIEERPTLKPASTITGCLSGDRTHAEMYRMPSQDRDRRSDAPQREHRLQIGGGLLPSATIAGQAGALDASRVAVIVASENLETDRLPPPDLSREPPSLLAMAPTGRCR